MEGVMDDDNNNKFRRSGLGEDGDGLRSSMRARRDRLERRRLLESPDVESRPKADISTPVATPLIAADVSLTSSHDALSAARAARRSRISNEYSTPKIDTTGDKTAQSLLGSSKILSMDDSTPGPVRNLAASPITEKPVADVKTPEEGESGSFRRSLPASMRSRRQRRDYTADDLTARDRALSRELVNDSPAIAADGNVHDILQRQKELKENGKPAKEEIPPVSRVIENSSPVVVDNGETREERIKRYKEMRRRALQERAAQLGITSTEDVSITSRRPLTRRQTSDGLLSSERDLTRDTDSGSGYVPRWKSRNAEDMLSSSNASSINDLHVTRKDSSASDNSNDPSSSSKLTYENLKLHDKLSSHAPPYSSLKRLEESTVTATITDSPELERKPADTADPKTPVDKKSSDKNIAPTSSSAVETHNTQTDLKLKSTTHEKETKSETSKTQTLPSEETKGLIAARRQNFSNNASTVTPEIKPMPSKFSMRDPKADVTEDPKIPTSIRQAVTQIEKADDKEKTDCTVEKKEVKPFKVKLRNSFITSGSNSEKESPFTKLEDRSKPPNSAPVKVRTGSFSARIKAFEEPSSATTTPNRSKKVETTRTPVSTVTTKSKVRKSRPIELRYRSKSLDRPVVVKRRRRELSAPVLVKEKQLVRERVKPRPRIRDKTRKSKAAKVSKNTPSARTKGPASQAAAAKRLSVTKKTTSKSQDETTPKSRRTSIKKSESHEETTFRASRSSLRSEESTTLKSSKTSVKKAGSQDGRFVTTRPDSLTVSKRKSITDETTPQRRKSAVQVPQVTEDASFLKPTASSFKKFEKEMKSPVEDKKVVKRVLSPTLPDGDLPSYMKATESYFKKVEHLFAEPEEEEEIHRIDLAPLSLNGEIPNFMKPTQSSEATFKPEPEVDLEAVFKPKSVAALDISEGVPNFLKPTKATENREKAPEPEDEPDATPPKINEPRRKISTNFMKSTKAVEARRQQSRDSSIDRLSTHSGSRDRHGSNSASTDRLSTYSTARERRHSQNSEGGNSVSRSTDRHGSMQNGHYDDEKTKSDKKSPSTKKDGDKERKTSVASYLKKKMGFNKDSSKEVPRTRKLSSNKPSDGKTVPSYMRDTSNTASRKIADSGDKLNNDNSIVDPPAETTEKQKTRPHTLHVTSDAKSHDSVNTVGSLDTKTKHSARTTLRNIGRKISDTTRPSTSTRSLHGSSDNKTLTDNKKEKTRKISLPLKRPSTLKKSRSPSVDAAITPTNDIKSPSFSLKSTPRKSTASTPNSVKTPSTDYSVSGEGTPTSTDNDLTISMNDFDKTPTTDQSSEPFTDFVNKGLETPSIEITSHDSSSTNQPSDYVDTLEITTPDSDIPHHVPMRRKPKEREMKKAHSPTRTQSEKSKDKNGLSSLAQRSASVRLRGTKAQALLSSLQNNGEEGWKRRIGEKDFSSFRGGSIHDRLSKIQDDSKKWTAKKGAENDANQFTVEGKMTKQGVEPKSAPSPLMPRKNRPDSSIKRVSSLKIKRESQNSTPVKKVVDKPTTSSSDSRVSASPALSTPALAITSDFAVNSKAEETVVVEVPSIDECTEFFTPISAATQNGSMTHVNGIDDVEYTVDDLDDIFIKSAPTLGAIKKPKAARRQAGSKNPVKSLQARTDLVTELTQNKSNYLEEELRRVNREKIAANAERQALAGLATKEDISKVSLKKMSLSSVRATGGSAAAPYKDLMLIQIKGRRHVEMRLVEPTPKSINSGDCFLLITRDKIFQWIGEFCNYMEKSKCLDLSNYIHKKKDLGFTGTRPVITIEESRHIASNDEFWKLLGGNPTYASTGPAEEDELYEQYMSETNLVYEVEEHALVLNEQLSGVSPKYEILHDNKMYIFDFGTEIYSWCGKHVPLAQRKAGMKLARLLFDQGYDYTDFDINPMSPLVLPENGGLSRHSQERPDWCLCGKVTSRMETLLFKEKFADWPESSRLIQVKDASVKSGTSSPVEELKPYDVLKMLERPDHPISLVLENSHIGRGKHWVEYEDGIRREYDIVTNSIRMWHVSMNEYYEMFSDSFGQLHSGGTYVVQWDYRRDQKHQGKLKGVTSTRNSRSVGTGRDRTVFFFWLGKNSTINQKGASALMTIELDADRHPQIRVEEGQEPACFLSLFNGRTITHNGRRDDDITRPYKLYVVLHENPDETSLHEVPCKIESLRSRGSFILLDLRSGDCFVWYGCASTRDMRRNALSVAEKIQESCPMEIGVDLEANIRVVEIEEGKENRAFMLALRSNNRTRYDSLINTKSQRDHTYISRLFYMTSVNLTFQVEEIISPSKYEGFSAFPFTQDQLYSASQPALYMLDFGEEVYLWEGWFTKESEEQQNIETGTGQMRFGKERELAIHTALNYINAQSGICKKASIVHAGREPLSFTTRFPVWEPVKEAVLAAHGKPAVSEDLRDAHSKLSETQFFTWDELQQKPLPDGVNPNCLESYLYDEEFEANFKMSRKEFEALPSWKQTHIRKDVGLF